MSAVGDRCARWRARGLDVAGDRLWGFLTPEICRALAGLHDRLVVGDVMDAPRVRVILELPPDVETLLDESWPTDASLTAR